MNHRIIYLSLSLSLSFFFLSGRLADLSLSLSGPRRSKFYGSYFLFNADAVSGTPADSTRLCARLPPPFSTSCLPFVPLPFAFVSFPPAFLPAIVSRVCAQRTLAGCVSCLSFSSGAGGRKRAKIQRTDRISGRPDFRETRDAKRKRRRGAKLESK